MMKMTMSRAAAGLLRDLLDRVGTDKDRVLLTDVRSVDWHSLTFAGERHEIALRIIGPHADRLAASLTDGITDFEFRIPGQIVAEVAVGSRIPRPDGSLLLALEALTIAE